VFTFSGKSSYPVTRSRKECLYCSCFGIPHEREFGTASTVWCITEWWTGSHMGSRWAMGVELVQEQGLVGAMPLFRVLDAALDTPTWKEIPTLLGIGCSWSWQTIFPWGSYLIGCLQGDPFSWYKASYELWTCSVHCCRVPWVRILGCWIA
jgi:hypothetical protein